ncbi:MAG: SIMPL domain-containing protein [Bacteriovoracaceae bacterium]|nr:SIMPL domain-containing protein [Bacteriovoracaceae bacterium]
MKFLLSLLIFSLSCAFAEEQEHGIKVIGECKQRVQPDRLAISFVVETLKDSVDASTAQANKKYNTLLENLKALKLKNAEFDTFEYSSAPYKVYENRKNVFKGYKTRIGLKVSTSEMDKAGEIFQVGSIIGQEFIQGPNPYVSDNLAKKTYEKCLVIASNDAKDKAQVLAKSLDVVLGKAFNVKESVSNRPTYKSNSIMNMAESVSSAPAKIEFGKSDIELKLEVYFTIN